MKSKLKRAVTLLALMGAASGGAAHATEGWYGRLDAGYSVDGELDLDQGGALGFEDDWMFSGGAGYAFQNGFRFEGELSYRSNDLQDLPDADASAWAAMANVYYDFNRDGRVQPYIGVGVGGARIDTRGVVGPISWDSDDTVVAYQAMAGVAFPLGERWDLDIGYRYFLAPGAGVDGTVDFEVPEPFSFDADYMHQAVTVGLRYQFASPAAAPPPAPPPALPPPPAPPPVAVCPATDFVVYFEWDRSNLNASAIETIDAAVARAHECNIAGIVVVGHTDTSGSNEYNQALSERRSGVVRDALVARGIAADAITAQARGETDLAQQTRDGVREPLNRRTAVTISFR